MPTQYEAHACTLIIYKRKPAGLAAESEYYTCVFIELSKTGIAVRAAPVFLIVTSECRLFVGFNGLERRLRHVLVGSTGLCLIRNADVLSLLVQEQYF